MPIDPTFPSLWPTIAAIVAATCLTAVVSGLMLMMARSTAIERDYSTSRQLPPKS